jgi:outer membrane protein assembly factor BamA
VYADDAVEADVRALYATDQFTTVEAGKRAGEDGRVTVEFVLREFPTTVQKITYLGAKHLSDEELNVLTDLLLHRPFDAKAAGKTCQVIVRRYNELGRPFAECQLLRGDQADDTEVVFQIAEGPKVAVHEVKFEGSNFVSGAVLKTHLGRCVNGVDDVERLEEYYRSFGFRDVRVSRELEWTEDGRKVNLIFHIQEGRRQRPREGQGGGQCSPTEPATPAQDKPAVKGPVRVGQIFILGNTRTSDSVIIDSVALYPGAVLNVADLRRAEENLLRLNRFAVNPQTGAGPTVTVIEGDEKGPYRDIVIQVQEKDEKAPR